MFTDNDIVVVSRDRFAELERVEEKIACVQRMHDSGQCYSLDTVLAVIGVKIQGAERVALSGDPLADDGK